MSKRALLVGCNYPGTSAELHGCVNDVTRMQACLVERFGFSESDIKLMIDTDESSEQPTGRNIKAALRELIDVSEPGDVLFFHYSGHGTQVPAESGDTEDDGKDEAIVPTDLNLLTDDDFRTIFNRLAEGVSFTFVSDSCHSGGLLDSEEVQIGMDDDGEVGDETVEDEGQTRDFSFRNRHARRHSNNKELSIETLTQMLSERTGYEVKPGQIRTTLYDMFADDASPTVKVFVNLIEQRIQQGYSEDDVFDLYGEVGALAYAFVKSKIDDGDVDTDAFLSGAHNLPESGVNTSGHANAKPDSSEQLSPSVGVLVSGSQSNETSADANPTGDPSQAYGALSNAIQEILSGHDGSITNCELVTAVRSYLKKKGFEQHPCLYCSDEAVDVPFICEQVL